MCLRFVSQHLDHHGAIRTIMRTLLIYEKINHRKDDDDDIIRSSREQAHEKWAANGQRRKMLFQTKILIESHSSVAECIVQMIIIAPFVHQNIRAKDENCYLFGATRRELSLELVQVDYFCFASWEQLRAKLSYTVYVFFYHIIVSWSLLRKLSLSVWWLLWMDEGTIFIYSK